MIVSKNILATLLQIRKIYSELSSSFLEKKYLPNEVFGKALAVHKNNTSVFDRLTSNRVIAEAVEVVQCEMTLDILGIEKATNEIRKAYLDNLTKPSIEDLLVVRFDTNRFFQNSASSEMVEVDLLAIENVAYLVHDWKNERVAVAYFDSSNPAEQSPSRMHCSMARSYGEGSSDREQYGFTTIEAAAKDLGFNLK